MTIEEFAQVLLAQTRERLARLYSQSQADNEHVEVITGRTYDKVNLGTMWNGHIGHGKFMVERSTGIIYGIKGYGQVHKGYAYGTLGTVDQWYWGDYYPRRLTGRS
jgi:hypothetical protein